MDQLLPVLMNFLEEKARPHVQGKVTEEVDEAKVDMKDSLPDQALDFIKGVGEAGEESGNALIAMIVDRIGGDSLKERIKSVTNLTVDTAAEGMDILLTNGIMNVAKGVMTKTVAEDGEASGGFNFDFLKSGKEGMIDTTMVLSQPVIKQVSGNIGRKISSHLPAAIGGSIQEMIDSTGGSFSPIGMAAKLFMKVAGVGDDDDDEKSGATTRGGDEDDAKKEGGHLGPIQRALQKLLAPKIMEFIGPYMENFESKMNTSLEGELRNKVFNIDYIKQTALSMLTGASEGAGGLGGLLSAFMGASGGGRKGGDDDEEGGGGGAGGGDALNLIGNLAQNFLKNRG
ncbi:hypothetical protein DFQ26_000736 [Actinomortierella ambigua]|nr:hypothetical protein DFQ26_000736 [Actinomortierella ambigua]